MSDLFIYNDDNVTCKHAVTTVKLTNIQNLQHIKKYSNFKIEIRNKSFLIHYLEFF